MANQVTRQGMVRWLLRNGFVEQTGRATSHRRFTRRQEGSTGSITIPGHGPNDLTKKHVGMILRQLERMGFDKAQVLNEVTGKRKRS